MFTIQYNQIVKSLFRYKNHDYHFPNTPPVTLMKYVSRGTVFSFYFMMLGV